MNIKHTEQLWMELHRYFGSGMPEEIYAELEALEKRLEPLTAKQKCDNDAACIARRHTAYITGVGDGRRNRCIKCTCREMSRSELTDAELDSWAMPIEDFED
jgi:hypothetical protein